MMQRLLTVTYGYLRFTLFSLLGATALFAFTGLAITAPSTASVVLLVAISMGFLIRQERLGNRRTQEIVRRAKANPNLVKDTVDELLAFGQVISLLALPTEQSFAEDASAFWILEVESLNTPARTKSSPSEGITIRETDEEVERVVENLERHRSQLAAIGLHPLVISRAPADYLVDVFRKSILEKARSVVAIRTFETTPNQSHGIISIALVQRTKTPKVHLASVQRVLGDSPKLLRAHILQTGSGAAASLRFRRSFSN